MKMISTKKNSLLKAIMFLAILAGTTNTIMADGTVTVKNVSNTNCHDDTRAESVMGHPTLKLTRFENGLLGELNNYRVNCAYGRINVMCQEEGQKLALSVDEGLGDVIASCMCSINIYFTLYDALEDEYQMMLGGKDLGTISFKEHSVVEIDLETLEQANEEGFDYPVNVQGFWSYEITDYITPGKDLSQSLEINDYGSQWFDCVYKNYSLPCEYTYLDVQAEFDKDSTLVISVLTDGIPEKSCNRAAHLFFNIVNILKESYHLRLNHTILTKDEDGQDKAYTVCLYEGDITLSSKNGYNVSIPITDNNDYRALITGLTPQSPSDANSVRNYDLQGRRITDRTQKGVQIRDGRKVVVK